MALELIRKAIKTLRNQGLRKLLTSADNHLRANSIYNQIRYHATKIYAPKWYPKHLYYRWSYPSPVPEPYRVLWIDPDDIQYLIDPPFISQYSKYGTHIIGGDWDEKFPDRRVGVHRGLSDPRGISSFENYMYAQSVKAYLSGQTQFVETQIHKEYNYDMGLNEKRKIDHLYSSIRKKGYHRQEDLSPVTYPPSHGEIMVDINRDGEFIFEDGRHRLSIAKHLGLDQIPVRVFVRHESWQQLRSEIYHAESKSKLSEKTIQNLNHPDINHLLDM